MLPRCWRLTEQRYRLQGVQCPVCGKVSLLAHPMCCKRTAKGTNGPESPTYTPSFVVEVGSLQARACILPATVIEAEAQSQLERP